MNKEKVFIMKMDEKLYSQLKRYSNHKNQSLARTARQAIKSFILETTTIDKINKL